MIWNAIIYYLLVFPASLLPLRVIYVFTDCLYILLTSVLPYRKKVIKQNLKNSFPNKSEKEIQQLSKRFYRHLTDLLAESVKGLSISKKDLKKRFKVQNSDLLDELYANNQSVLLVSGHYNNWEWLILSQALLFNHKAVGVGMPLSNGFWDKKLNQRRGRFGMDIINSNNVREYFENKKEPTATLLLTDQSPGDSTKSFWMEFLNQKTPVLFGAEMFAHQYNEAVVFFHLEKIKRGRYVMHLKKITDQPKSMSWGEITIKHTKMLEKVINERPEYWLWSHKRWKREVPNDIENLALKQREKFNQKFNY